MKPNYYVKYGEEWHKEVMKNKKEVLVEMLRRVAIERDSLEAAQQSMQRTACTHTVTKRSATGSITCVLCGDPL